MAGSSSPLDNIISTAKNIVNALSHIQNVIIRNQGNATSATVTASTLVCSGFGRVVTVTVTVAGGAAGTINNAASTASAAAGNALMAVPNTVGVYNAGHSFNLGLVIVPGAGQSINVTYYQEN